MLLLYANKHCSAVKDAHPYKTAMMELSPTELKDRLSADQSLSRTPPLLLDVREQWEYDITHLPNSLLLPVSEIATRLDELDPQRETVVICHHGIRSMKIAQVLIGVGFERVINLRGGLDAWAKEADPSIPVYTGR